MGTLTGAGGDQAVTRPKRLSKSTLHPTSQSSKLHSCALCHRRKVKCDKLNPCTYCRSRNVACVPVAAPIPGPRKRRFPEAELLARLRRYEAALKTYGADIDAINSSDEFASPSTATESPSAVQNAWPQTRNRGLQWLTNTNDVEGTERMLKMSSDEQQKSDASPLFMTYDEAYGSPLVLYTGIGASIDLASLHPPAVQILQLWQAYLDNVHPLLKFIHAPSIQQQLFRNIHNLSSMTPSMHALLFAVFAAAIESIPEAETALFDAMAEDRYTLTCRYHAATRFALQRAGFLRSSDRTVLSANILCVTPDADERRYQISMNKTVDPRLLLCMAAAAERSAKRNGYHLNTTKSDISSFEAEMRRRVWWQLVALQNRVAETAAAGPSALSWDWQTSLPLNANESDLDSEMKATPARHELPTDMIFCLVRYEIADFLRQVWVDTRKHVPDFAGSEFSNPCIALGDKLSAIDAFQRDIQTRYVDKCDSHTPLHIMTRYLATYSFSKMRITAYATAMNSGELLNPELMEKRRQSLMQTCLEAIEAYTSCFSNKALEGFNWFLSTSVPFLAYVHLLFHLRFKPLGELADLAWAAVNTKTDLHGRPKWVWSLNPSWYEPEDSAMQIALANLTVKAWEAREAASDSNDSIQVPAIVSKMQEKLALGRDQQRPTSNALVPANGPDPSPNSNNQLPVGHVALQLPVQDMPAEDDIAMLDIWNSLLLQNLWE